MQDEYANTDTHITTSNEYPSLPYSIKDTIQIDYKAPSISGDTNPTTVDKSVAGTNPDPITPTQIQKPKKKGNIANLKPFKKGQSGNPGGKPKGAISLKRIYEAKLTKEAAEKFVESVIKGAESGDDKKQERLMKLSGEFEANNAPAVNIQNNTLQISEEVMEAARLYLEQKYQADIKQIENI